MEARRGPRYLRGFGMEVALGCQSVGEAWMVLEPVDNEADMDLVPVALKQVHQRGGRDEVLVLQGMVVLAARTTPSTGTWTVNTTHLVGRRCLYRRTDLDVWVAEHRVKTNAA